MDLATIREKVAILKPSIVDRSIEVEGGQDKASLNIEKKRSLFQCTFPMVI